MRYGKRQFLVISLDFLFYFFLAIPIIVHDKKSRSVKKDNHRTEARPRVSFIFPTETLPLFIRCAI